MNQLSNFIERKIQLKNHCSKTNAKRTKTKTMKLQVVLCPVLLGDNANKAIYEVTTLLF